MHRAEARCECSFCKYVFSPDYLNEPIKEDISSCCLSDLLADIKAFPPHESDNHVETAYVSDLANPLA